MYVKVKSYQLVLLISVLALSCTSSDDEFSPDVVGPDQVSSFMDYNGDNLHVLNMIEAFNKENNIDRIINTIINDYGYAKWDYALFNQSRTNTGNEASPTSGDAVPELNNYIFPQVNVPIINTRSGQIIAFIAFKKFESGRYVFRFYSKRKLTKIPYERLRKNKLDVTAALVLLIFENRINSKNSMKLYDATINFKSQSSTGLEYNYELQCQDWEICWEPPVSYASGSDCTTGTNCDYVLVYNGGGSSGSGGPLPSGGGGAGNPDYNDIGSDGIFGVNPEQTSFPPINYLNSSRSKRISHIFNFLRYSKKNKKKVDLKTIFTDFPSHGPNGLPHDNFSGSIIMGDNIVPITLIEVPILNGWNVFNSNMQTAKEVSLRSGIHFNIEYFVDCGDCHYPLRAMLIQVRGVDLDIVRDFLDGR